jgi:hypothetical protein
MHSSFSYIKVITLLLFLVGLVSQKHAFTSFGDRATFHIFFLSFVNRITTKEINAGATYSFDLSQNEWKIFKVSPKFNIDCICIASCDNPSNILHMYMTFERRPRLNYNWDGWVCKETEAFNTQTCAGEIPEPDATCRVAVRGDTFDRPHSQCSITCYIG